MAVEGLGGLFEGGDEFLVCFDAGGEGVVFGDDFALFFYRGDGDLHIAEIIPDFRELHRLRKNLLRGQILSEKTTSSDIPAAAHSSLRLQTSGMPET